MLRFKRYAIVFILVCSVVQPLVACDVPVFRYAMERWQSDPYLINFFHREPISIESQKVLDYLQEVVNADIPTNIVLQVFDLSEIPVDEQPAEIAEKKTPFFKITYPKGRQRFWSGNLTLGDAKNLVDSPQRREVLSRLLQGQTAVWVLMESGDTEKDTKAFQTLETEIKRMNETLKLPVIDLSSLIETGDEDINLDQLRVEFSIVRLPKSSASIQSAIDEAFFSRMLLHSELDLIDYLGEPMAFPIFGRGLILYALVGEGINSDMIDDACQFLVGPCSCVVKDLNPGTDLIARVDWDGAIKSSLVDRKEMAQFFDLDRAVDARIADTTSSIIQTSGTVTESQSSSLMRNMIIVFCLIVVINGVIAFRLFRKRES